jgi:hypothetical protein
MFDISEKQVSIESVSGLQAEIDLSHDSAGLCILNIVLENGDTGTFRIFKDLATPIKVVHTLLK